MRRAFQRKTPALGSAQIKVDEDLQRLLKKAACCGHRYEKAMEMEYLNMNDHDSSAGCAVGPKRKSCQWQTGTTFTLVINLNSELLAGLPCSNPVMQ